MLQTALQLPELETLDPFEGDCPRCGAVVLAVEIDGAEVVVELAEVLPEFPCPSCEQVAGRGHRRGTCSRCGRTGTIGEPLPLRGVAIAESGAAREFRGERHEGEAVHVFHACIAVL